MDEEEKEKEKRHREVAFTRSSTSLVWAGFALTNFVLIVTIFSALSVKTNVVFEISAGFFLVSGVLFSTSWALFEISGSAYRIKLKNRRTGEDIANPREHYAKQAEYFTLAGTLSWSLGVVLFLLFLEMYLALAIFVVSLMLVYPYVVPRYFLWRQ